MSNPKQDAVDELFPGGAPQDRPDDLAGVNPDREEDARHALRSSLATVVPASATPYGYTLAIWSCGALLLRSHGTPSVADTLMFVAGAIAGFNLLGVIAIGAIGRARPIERRQDRVLAGVLDWVALGAVVAAVFAISRMHGWAPWLLGPVTATILYLLIATLQLAALTVDRIPDRGD
ncbi:MAG TPA: hypothetical protein VMA77_11155 [Solirubrobacteraceae bacterium]|nr:hypothetical protein [Solirubrobacteraceae bacterium]